MDRIIAFLQAAVFAMLSLLQISVPGIQGPDGKPGLPAWDTAVFAEAMEARMADLRTKTFGLAPRPRCNIVFDETLTAVVDDLEAEAKFSLPALLGLFPDPFYPFRPAARLFASPIAWAQTELNAKSKSISGHPYFADHMLRLLSVNLGMAKEVRLACEPLDSPDLYEIVCQLTYEDGRRDQLRSRIYYDARRKLMYGSDGGGMMSLGYDYDVANRVIFTQPEVWMRALGFCEAYDILGNNCGVFQFDTVRLKFPYAGQDWMLQLWKGRYSFACGGEVGLYRKPTGRPVEFYDCAEEAEYLSMSLRVTVARDRVVLVDRPAQPHWWMTGFQMSDRYYRPAELTLETSVTMKDEDMLDAVRAALDAQTDKVAYTIKGLTVTIVW